MKIKSWELTGPALDWAVAKCEGHDAHYYSGVVRTCMKRVFGPELHYSTDWAQGGPIIERESICVARPELGSQWIADKYYDTDRVHRAYGFTALTAAMRSYVRSKLGDEVEIPEELK